MDKNYSLAGNNIEVRAELNGTFNGLSVTDKFSKSVNVVETRDLTLTFVAVNGPTEFESTALDSIDFIDKVYPLKDNGIISELNYTSIQSIAIEHNSLGLYLLLHRIHKSTLIAGEKPERSVGVVPNGWFADNLNDPSAIGMSLPLYHSAVLVEEDFGNNNFFDHISAHELGHTYGLCDEYNETEWDRQNRGIFGLSSNVCPNGDQNNDEILDSECLTEGCPTSTLQPLNGLPDGFEIHNFMGSTITIDSWISQESYNHLLGEFNHSTPINVQSRAVISGQVNKTSGIVAKFDNFYTLGAGLAENQSDHKKGNYSIQVFGSGNSLLYNISFDVSFLNIFFNGSTIENNNSAFAFTIPLNSSTSSIVLKQNGITKDVRNVSASIPTIQLTSPSGGQTFSNQNISVNWNASDIDGDNLSYAVLFSSDNGSNYNTIIFDHNTTNFNISSNDLSDCKLCRIKILATDGVNTNESISNSFGIDNNLNYLFQGIYYPGIWRENLNIVIFMS